MRCSPPQRTDSAFVWLHSVDDPRARRTGDQPVPVLSTTSRVELSDRGESRPKSASPRPTTPTVYVTVRATDSLEGFSANLYAPILDLKVGRGHQVINQTADAPVLVPRSSSGRPTEERVPRRA